MIRRRALPSGVSDGSAVLPSAAAPVLASEAGNGEARQVCSLRAADGRNAGEPGVSADVQNPDRDDDPQPEYEIDDPAGGVSSVKARFAGGSEAADDDVSEGA